MILHIAYGNDWRQAQERGEYAIDSLQKDGFIHCSTLEQLLIPANTHFRSKPDLVLLCIDETKVTAPVVYEDCYDSHMQFPHIYGPLNLDAVTQVLDFVPQADGTFALPMELLS